LVFHRLFSLGGNDHGVSFGYIEVEHERLVDRFIGFSANRCIQMKGSAPNLVAVSGVNVTAHVDEGLDPLDPFCEISAAYGNPWSTGISKIRALINDPKSRSMSDEDIRFVRDLRPVSS
jgi:hypothetical protein